MANLIGQTLLGQYHIEEFIDSGGMGAVFRVRDLKRNVWLAMKTMHSDLAEDASIMRRFRREALALSRLSHPHIVRTYGLYQAGGLVFLLQDYIDGWSLKNLLEGRASKTLSILEAMIVMRALCSALGFAHASGVIHCDIKPANVMVDRTGKVYLTDFGIARHADNTTTTFAQAGAPAYMSPEQILGKPVNAATDIYALGVLLFECLTGCRPFLGSEASAMRAGATTGERLRFAHLHLPPPQPNAINPDISFQMGEVILKSLAKQPARRYPSAASFLDAFTASAGMDVERIPSFLSVPKIPPIPKKERSSTPIQPSSPGGPPKTAVVLYFIVGAIALAAVLALIGLVRSCGGQLISNIAQPEQAAAGQFVATDALESETPVDEFEPLVDEIAPPADELEPSAEEAEAPEQDLRSETADEPLGKIVYTCQVSRQVNQDQICLMNADGSGRKQLTQDLQYQHYYASLSPDGASIVFSSSRNGGMEIFEMDVDGRNIRQLTSGLGECFAPDISPDGQRVVFLRNQNGKNYISLMTRDGSFLGDLSDHYECKDPTWSPDGSKILFASSESGTPQFYTMNSDGSQVRQITNMAGFRGRSDWGPDGTMASYAGDSQKHDREIVFFDENSAPYFMTSGGDNLAPSFSPDGQWITFMSYRDNFWDADGCEIYIMRLSDGYVERLTSNNSCDYQPRWGP